MALDAELGAGGRSSLTPCSLLSSCPSLPYRLRRLANRRSSAPALQLTAAHLVALVLWPSQRR